MRQDELIRMTNREREVQNELLKAEKALKDSFPDGLDAGQKAELEVLIKRNQALKDQADMLAEIKGPQQEFNFQVAALNALLSQGEISVAEYEAKLKELRDALMGDTANSFEVLGDIIESTFSSAFSELDKGAKGAAVTFRGFATSVLADLSRIAAKQATMAIMSSLTGGLNIGGFAEGGSFKVGGQGGTDSQLVAFNATPGERVTVATPAQQFSQGGSGQQTVQAAAPVINIINILDPNEIASAMASAEGEKVIINVLSRNRETVRQAIS